jgi:hypothetical protein
MRGIRAVEEREKSGREIGNREAVRRANGFFVGRDRPARRLGGARAENQNCRSLRECAFRHQALASLFASLTRDSG